MTSRAEKRMNWIFWSISTLLIFIATYFHQPWRDEAQAVNLALDSTGWWDLIQRIRWEGHPILWFAIIKIFGASLTPWIHGAIAASTNALIVFKSGWPKFVRWSLPFTYYFIFEYAVIYRDYAVGIFLLFAATHLWNSKPYLSFTLLLLAAQANFFAAILGAALGLKFFLDEPKHRRWYWMIPLALLWGSTLIYQFTPPENGGFASGWHFGDATFADAFLTVGAGTTIPFTLDGVLLAGAFGSISVFIGIVVTLQLWLILYKRQLTRSGWIFLGVSALILLFCSVKIYGYPRHLMHIWILFLILQFGEQNKTRSASLWGSKLIVILVIGQVLAGLSHIYIEIARPFDTRYSNAYRVADFLLENDIPAESVAVFPENRVAAISLRTNESYYLPVMDTVMNHLIWSAKSQENLSPRGLRSQLLGHFGPSKVVLITPKMMHEHFPRVRNEWKTVLDPKRLDFESSPTISGERFYIYEIDLSERPE